MSLVLDALLLFPATMNKLSSNWTCYLAIEEGKSFSLNLFSPCAHYRRCQNHWIYIFLFYFIFSLCLWRDFFFFFCYFSKKHIQASCCCCCIHFKQRRKKMISTFISLGRTWKLFNTFLVRWYEEKSNHRNLFDFTEFLGFWIFH